MSVKSPSSRCVRPWRVTGEGSKRMLMSSISKFSTPSAAMAMARSWATQALFTAYSGLDSCRSISMSIFSVLIMLVTA